MKKLLLLLALVTAFYYAKSYAISPKEWETCANKAARPAIMQSQQENEKFIKNVCTFYNKSMNECLAILDASSEQEMNQILSAYLLHGIIIPECGTPDEDK